MKSTITKALAGFILLILCQTSYAQVFPYSENFNSMPPNNNPVGWTCTLPGFQVYSGHGVSASQALSRGVGTFSMLDSTISPLIGPITPASLLIFSYRIVQYIGATPIAINIMPGEKIEVELTGSGGFATELTIDNTNHIPDTAFVTQTISLDTHTGTNINVMFKVTSNVSEFFIDIDNVSVNEPAGINQLNQSIETARVYPDPVTPGELLSVKNIKPGNYKVAVANEQGRILLQTEAAINHSSGSLINTGGLASGMYIVSLTNEKNNYQLKFAVK